eukprot:TRINITY_DN3196_c0_g1_i1.p5 TRINITY_DN3196_c0_g1~~TRINITY_DN3196_c0_g1_i1.p5  ORF type:complete len:138 (-),score=6.11 TRINITY_DN3196_c0_g1_i1:1142-1555(-)
MLHLVLYSNITPWCYVRGKKVVELLFEQQQMMHQFFGDTISMLWRSMIMFSHEKFLDELFQTTVPKWRFIKIFWGPREMQQEAVLKRVKVHDSPIQASKNQFFKYVMMELFNQIGQIYYKNTNFFLVLNQTVLFVCE